VLAVLAASPYGGGDPAAGTASRSGRCVSSVAAIGMSQDFGNLPSIGIPSGKSQRKMKNFPIAKGPDSVGPNLKSFVLSEQDGRAG
jgi:hypothetical protein